jgi:hypothetical protein
LSASPWLDMRLFQLRGVGFSGILKNFVRHW